MTTTGDQTIRRWSDVLMPRTFTLWTMVLAVASVISQAGIIVTGGAVRLTASGSGLLRMASLYTRLICHHP